MSPNRRIFLNIVATYGAVIGSESFISKIVKSEEEAFPTETPPVDFGIDGVVLKTLRNLKILR